jgi:ABC-type proline/glycine betaine transport system ATPase subunit
MRSGQIEQKGTPHELQTKPATEYVTVLLRHAGLLS